MNRRGRARRVFFVLAIGLGFGVAQIMAQEVAPAPLPVAPYQKNDKGLIVAEVKFAADGKVAACRVVRSNAPFPLEAATVDAIKREWNEDWLAGQTIDFPITFDELPWYATHWDDDLVPPPNILPLGDTGRKMKLRITFGADGWVEHASVLQSSGIELVDRQTSIWVKVHWHNDAFAGRTLDAPFEFKGPLGSKPTVAKKPPSKPNPAEPTAPPAVRVE
jgi:hypothetical protein